MGGYTVYLVGFNNADLSSDEQGKLDSHKAKWKAGLSGETYSPLDKRDSSFQDVANTFADEKRPDGKHIIIYQELNIDKGEKAKFLDIVNDIKSTLPNILIEAHDEGGKIG